jgi:phosphoribosyl-ATP pyrophosphohydrolase
VHDVMQELRPFVHGFLVTFVEREGRLVGLDLDAVGKLRQAAGEHELTIAGGVQSPADVQALDALGVHAQVGMALYTGRFTVADAVVALLPMTADGLWPTVVVDEDERALGLCWSNAASLRAALDRGVGIYWSRRRGLWEKGASSGARQQLLRVDLDCDRDALRFVVRQHGPGFCHRATATCWGELRGLPALTRRLAASAARGPASSYTARLLADPDWLRHKLGEEALELATADPADRAAVVHEAADLVYFTAVALQRAGLDFAAIGTELDRRARQVTKRPGLAKPEVGR